MEMVTRDKVKKLKVRCLCTEWAMYRMKPPRIKREVELEMNTEIKEFFQ